MKKQRSVIKTVKDAIISIDIMKNRYERERCDTRFVVMRWSNSEVSLRQ